MGYLMNLQQKYKQSFGKGWFLHSWQHALAAKGVKTRKYQVKIYSVRPFKEKFDKKVYPSELVKHDASGRHTGWFGTGIYGFKHKEQAEERIKEGAASGYVRPFDIKRPFVLDSAFESDALHDASKKMYRGDYGKNRETPQGFSWGDAIMEFKRAGLDVTEKELDESRAEAEKKQLKPINVLLKKRGYTGVIPSESHQTFSHGSVKFYERGAPQDKTPFTEEELERKRVHQLEVHERARKQREQKQKWAEDDLNRALEDLESDRGMWVREKDLTYDQRRRIIPGEVHDDEKDLVLIRMTPEEKLEHTPFGKEEYAEYVSKKTALEKLGSREKKPKLFEEE